MLLELLLLVDFELLGDLEPLEPLLAALFLSSRSVGDKPPLVLREDDECVEVFASREDDARIEVDFELDVRPPPLGERRSDGESNPQPAFA